MFEIIYKLGAILAEIGLGLFEIIYELGAILATFAIGLVVFFGLIALLFYIPHLFSMLFVAFLKLIDLTTKFINKLEIFETKEKDNTEKIQPLVTEVKIRDMLEYLSVSELSKECRKMNPPPASGVEISGANKETLIDWLDVKEPKPQIAKAIKERLTMIREEKIKKRVELRKMKELEA